MLNPQDSPFIIEEYPKDSGGTLLELKFWRVALDKTQIEKKKRQIIADVKYWLEHHALEQDR